MLSVVSVEVVVGEADHDPLARDAGDLDGLADEEALRLPVERLRPGQVDLRLGRRCARVDQRELDRAGELDRVVGVDRALDVEAVVADAEHQVDDLDRALGAVRGERAVDELDGAVADATGEDRRLAERLRVAARVGRAEVEVLRQAEARQSRRRHRAGAVLLRAVVEQVEDVDLLRLGRLRADLEQRAVGLAGQLEPELERTVGAGDATLDGERTLELPEAVRRDREDLGAVTCDRHVEVDVGDELDRLAAGTSSCR